MGCEQSRKLKLTKCFQQLIWGAKEKFIWKNGWNQLINRSPVSLHQTPTSKFSFRVFLISAKEVLRILMNFHECSRAWLGFFSFSTFFCILCQSESKKKYFFRKVTNSVKRLPWLIFYFTCFSETKAFIWGFNWTFKQIFNCVIAYFLNFLLLSSSKTSLRLLRNSKENKIYYTFRFDIKQLWAKNEKENQLFQSIVSS